jgi:aminopeptidase N
MTPQKIYLKDYKPPTHQVLSTQLFFDLHEDLCRVRQKSKFKNVTTPASESLFLDGENLNLDELKINGKTYLNYKLTTHGLEIFGLPHEFEIEISTALKPQENTSLEGLYKSGGIFCTQCEAQGFRKITYFLDRPDVMTIYTVTIEADLKKYPVLLSNGDLIEQKKLNNGRHQAVWQDPHKKPCYLFALVAGDLGVLQDEFTTASGKKVLLEVYSAHGTQNRCQHAMESLKKSMRWDEVRYGREYDLSRYMILAVDDFNAGAMENKGLNIFNSRLVFADPKTATDVDYFNIESVVAHEYFHNWTGNRITLRDWFHLSLKEGLTVFRDQEFSMDMASPAQIRIDTVADLRSAQFAEDAGPNSHPIRPESCYAVDNFFTSTIYEKGSEVIRMMQTMVGRPGFRKGMDLYFNRHDGQAVIIEDFAKAIADANQQDWQQFKLWYSQSGTPTVKVEEKFNDRDQTYEVKLSQSCPPSPEQTEKKPFHIPLVVGLLDQNGNEIEISEKNNSPSIFINSEGQYVLKLNHKQEVYQFRNLPTRPYLSLNRFFSAPIKMDWQQSTKDLIFLLAHDTDQFNRWESAQKLWTGEFLSSTKNSQHSFQTDIFSAFNKLLAHPELPEDFKASCLEIPDDSYLLQLVEEFDAKVFLNTRNSLHLAMCQYLEKNLVETYQKWHDQNIFSKDSKDFGRRRLKNKCLSLLSEKSQYLDWVQKQFEKAKIMTDEIAAFSILCEQKTELKNWAIETFYQKWKTESLVINKWFQIQALSTHEDTFNRVVKLSEHSDFNIKNPNRVYALLLRFGDNLVQFHNPKNESYAFMADKIIELDKLNPQVATRVAGCFDVWKKLTANQKEKAHAALEKLVRSGLSSNTFEIVSKQLA